MSGTFNDCSDWQEQMGTWLKEKICKRIEEGLLVHKKYGAVTQNASECVGMIALIYRDKDTALGPTQPSGSCL